MSRPVIGITCYVEPARFTVWETAAALLPYGYVDHVLRAGGQPVILPPAGDPAGLLGRLDGLVLAGGGDIDPARYGQAPHDRTGYVRKARDDFELHLAAAALGAGLPLLGICRGLQILNTVLGGTLHQHLPDVVGHSGHSPAPGRFGRTPVRLAHGSRTAEILGAGTADVACHHHQAADRVGDGLAVTARSEDGAVEAVELAGHPFALAVQWHPEADDECALLAALVDRARDATESPGGGFRSAVPGR
ncbi:gamma-glutamyl-gamma-aminobutyrate hydrolase [Planomonospora parontospora subsp. parontospora]|uniref:Gamma-glutamyl-gamma-aminobutyrate hydrolase n=2 Tax=Planomonospora parontospora TaxID=58119 RepID=A0AA37BIQ9_9ACTN|nr:gamma-glutamyl-gamma-aminobutyrate hydrolase family protein [Planomonospora parontospora]GGK74676.1 gamma-glutamyl-gamma-aminobutyrate hydrolase [Planomonospora parontospora]GII09550.1 gamma-glutamyl-gamma-aminobutyrate hydrolase [Planomonospora parontospora subsp. parontospora]